MDRVEQLRKFIAATPDEPFPRYALALELKGRGELESAAAEMKELLVRKPDYLAAYLQQGMLLQALSRNEEAKDTYRRGQDLARRTGDGKALSELTQALDSLG
jgi:tetratricopeptide (TPR) repeat protein